MASICHEEKQEKMKKTWPLFVYRDEWIWKIWMIMLFVWKDSGIMHKKQCKMPETGIG